MSMVRLLALDALPCGCVVGRYCDVGTHRNVTYIEDKAQTCGRLDHRRNHVVTAPPPAAAPPHTPTGMRLAL